MSYLLMGTRSVRGLRPTPCGIYALYIPPLPYLVECLLEPLASRQVHEVKLGGHHLSVSSARRIGEGGGIVGRV